MPGTRRVTLSFRQSFSSDLTLLYRAVGPLVYLVVWGGIVGSDLLDPEPWRTAGALWMLAAPLGMLWVLWLARSIVVVQPTRSGLLLSGFVAECHVPAEAVESVSYWSWTRPTLISIRLRRSTPFGRRITLIPEQSLLESLGFGFLDRSAADELEAFLSRARHETPL